MPGETPGDVTDRLNAHAAGDGNAAEALLPVVYEKLRALARRMMRDERAGHTLDPTALVHEAYLKLIDVDRVDWKGRSHFCAMAARQMRRVLIDHARRHGARKRGGEFRRVTFSEHMAVGGEREADLRALHEALAGLEQQNERRCRVAEMRLLGGLRIAEIAHVLGVSERTVKGDWHMARAWLARELGRSRRGGAVR